MVVWTLVAALCTALLASIQTLGKLAILTWIGFASIFTAVLIVVCVVRNSRHSCALLMCPTVSVSPKLTDLRPHRRTGRLIWRSCPLDIQLSFLALWRSSIFLVSSCLIYCIVYGILTGETQLVMAPLRPSCPSSLKCETPSRLPSLFSPLKGSCQPVISHLVWWFIRKHVSSQLDPTTQDAHLVQVLWSVRRKSVAGERGRNIGEDCVRDFDSWLHHDLHVVGSSGRQICKCPHYCVKPFANPPFSYLFVSFETRRTCRTTVSYIGPHGCEYYLNWHTL